jgi:hypothetical protein
VRGSIGGGGVTQSSLLCFRKAMAESEDRMNIWLVASLAPWKNPASGGTL